MRKKNYTFHADAGHGWLAVPVIDVELAGVAEKISPYSYKKNGIAYLEEDCDMNRFLFALKEEGIDFEISDVYDGDDSVIRTYGRFS